MVLKDMLDKVAEGTTVEIWHYVADEHCRLRSDAAMDGYPSNHHEIIWVEDAQEFDRS